MSARSTDSAGVVRLKRSLILDDEEPEEPFVADHPCLWLLRHNPTNMWLFIGRLSQPTLSPVELINPAGRDEL